ncbi:T9SS type A sorting domain-containing protein, partial [Bacteroidales bacterium AH-315-I05]|nr:T9SS type A sorting domain-containing protein [Bacteroidales bacterium AH-315-I05]
VRISTTTPDIAGFNANAALLSITAENQTWTKRAVDLQAAGYSNQAVYIAFRNNSDDKFLLGIDNVSISEMGPLTYNWSNGGTTATATGLSAGSYSVTVTDGTCSVDTTITITQPAIVAPTVTSTDETTSGASDGTATATGSGGTSPYTYTWSNSATTQTISGLSPGIYMVTLTDANGCTGNGVAVVNLAGCTLTVTASSTDETVAGANDGTATATAANGTTPYSYDWIGVDTTQTITDLAPGVYNVVVTDTAGCLATASVTINAGAVGIADKTIESITLSVYPNPAKEYLNINLVLGKEDVFKIDIVNNIGQRVHFISGVKSSQFTDVINTSDWTSGLYFIMVQTPNAVKVEKLVIR